MFSNVSVFVIIPGKCARLFKITGLLCAHAGFSGFKAEAVSGDSFVCVCVWGLFSPACSDGARPVSRPSPRHLGVHDEVLREQMGTVPLLRLHISSRDTRTRPWFWYAVVSVVTSYFTCDGTSFFGVLQIQASFLRQPLKGMNNFRASGDYDNDCSAPLTPLCTQPEQAIKGKLKPWGHFLFEL